MRGQSFDELTEEQQKPYYKKAGELLSGLYWCTRVWDAWDVGTMREDDFIQADEDDEILHQTAQALYDGGPRPEWE